MPYANIKVIEGVFTDDEKKQMIKNVTEAIVAVEGEPLRDKTYVTLDETRCGSWGIGGRLITAEHVKHVRHGE